MGEKSKTLGELGENKVAYLMELLGWLPNTKNVSLSCTQSKEHSNGEGPRQTHGIDALYRYVCPLVANTLAFVVVSSKNQEEYLPKASLFKKFIIELAHTIECFQPSPLRRDISNSYDFLDRKYIGALFWLSEKTDKGNLIGKFSDESFAKELKNAFHSIIMIDDIKANFLFNSIRFVNNDYLDSKFYYHDTGYNSSPTKRMASGAVLPAEIVNSGLLTFKCLKNDKEYLVVATIEDFSPQVLKGLVYLSQNMTNNWAHKVDILFNSYNNLDEVKVSEVLLSVKDDTFTQKISVGSFNSSLRNLQRNGN